MTERGVGGDPLKISRKFKKEDGVLASGREAFAREASMKVAMGRNMKPMTGSH